jgi:hypothetical protein
MKIRTLAAAAAALAVIGMTSACVPSGEPLATPVSGTVALPTYGPGPVTTPVKKTRDPLTADGSFRIGTAPGEIPPGTYNIELTGSSGYYALCSDIPCKVTEGMLSNDFMHGPGVVEIPPNAVLMKDKRGIILIPTEG